MRNKGTISLFFFLNLFIYTAQQSQRTEVEEEVTKIIRLKVFQAKQPFDRWS